jgi:hypothetical protein
VGGGTSAKVVASDGYESKYTANDLSGHVTFYDPTTGEEIAGFGDTITMILAYEVDGMPLTSDEGGLRVGFVSATSNQVTKSSAWAKLVVSITATSE